MQELQTTKIYVAGGRKAYVIKRVITNCRRDNGEGHPSTRGVNNIYIYIYIYIYMCVYICISIGNTVMYARCMW